MQETRNNCFGSKKRSTTLLQAKTVKHEYRNVTAAYMFLCVSAFFNIFILVAIVSHLKYSVTQSLIISERKCCNTIKNGLDF